MHLAVAILRMGKGLDYSKVLGEDLIKNITEAPPTLISNDSSADLKINVTLSGSCDSLSRNVSQGTEFIIKIYYIFIKTITQVLC